MVKLITEVWFSTARPSTTAHPLKVINEANGTLSFVAPFGEKGLKITFPSLNATDKLLVGKYENLETGVKGEVTFYKKDSYQNNPLFSGKPCAGSYERHTWHLIFHKAMANEPASS